MKPFLFIFSTYDDNILHFLRMMNRPKNTLQYKGQVTERFTKIAICQGQGLCFVSSDKLLVGTLLNAFSLGTKNYSGK